MKKGKIKFFNATKGFGFIIPDDGGKDIFFHQSGLLDKNISQDDEVTFNLEEGKKGPIAVKIEFA